jgi:hypothetical protein
MPTLDDVSLEIGQSCRDNQLLETQLGAPSIDIDASKAITLPNHHVSI